MQKYIDIIQQSPFQRQQAFYDLGQEVLLPLQEQNLANKVFEFWSTLILEHDKWKGALLLPEIYRSNRGEPPLKITDMNYSIKEDFWWCCLYKKFNYFSYNEHGNINALEQPKTRLVYLDSQVKNSKGVLVKDKNIKKKISTGFTLEQRSIIIDVTMVGLIHNNILKKKVN